ncbi:uncharacterized protein LOC116846224 [Odontomachus brunneus]|uniref:uncharacterized protein LOC116846224 n=1 Tax=Odontomachus brunneus TaxID=486640 RepID=UPI0013F2612B|nr:uncharacterized protein LOC116846224 [Odontomachus brunneus]
MDTNAPLYLSRSDLEDCKCDAHSFEYKKIRYKRLADKERGSCKVNHEKISLTSSTLDIVPFDYFDTNKAMKSVYKTDYGKKEYSPLMTATDSQIERSVIPATTNWKDVYRDPIRFRYSAMETPTIQPAKTMSDLKVPETASFWYEPFTSSSEYTDKISKLGLSNMRNQQRFLKPLHPIKRKLSSCNL